MRFLPFIIGCILGAIASDTLSLHDSVDAIEQRFVVMAAQEGARLGAAQPLEARL